MCIRIYISHELFAKSVLCNFSFVLSSSLVLFTADITPELQNYLQYTWASDATS
jgi:hypothetical protein